MSNILFVSPVPTHPTTAGNRARVRALTDQLRDMGHAVSMMLVGPQADEDWGATLDAWAGRCVRVPYSRSTSILRRRLRRLAQRLGLESGYRFGLDDWYSPAVDSAIQRFVSDEPIDALVVEYVFMSRALLSVPQHVLKVIDTHDVFSNRHRRYLDQGEKPTWFSCTPADESRGLQRADLVLAIQDREAEEFRRLTQRRVLTIGHPATLCRLPPSRSTPRLLIVGSDNRINVTSLSWFVDEVFPIVRERQRDVELLVAGTLCRAIASPMGDNVVLLGPVPDLASAYAAANVVVNPTLFGTGLKIKTLEALGYGRALVTTPSGAEGLEDGSSTAFRVASEAADLAEEITHLLRNPEDAEQLGRRAYDFAAAYNRSIAGNLQIAFGKPR